MSNAPIGIFDSGVGGLTVARAILDQLPNESIIYIGDTARGPYGPRPLAEVREFALETLDFLVEQGVKALVIACNTASAAMLRDARERYKVPVIEVIQPAVRRAVAASRSGHIGVIGTRATVDSKAYLDAFAAAPQLQITSIACPLFVEFVERGETSGTEITKIARDYLAPVMEAKVDTLVLGCTHYPLQPLERHKCRFYTRLGCRFGRTLFHLNRREACADCGWGRQGRRFCAASAGGRRFCAQSNFDWARRQFNSALPRARLEGS